MKIFLFLFFILVSTCFSFGQQKKQVKIEKHPLDSEAFTKLLEETFSDYFSHFSNDKNVDSIIESIDIESTGDVTDLVLCQRLQMINELSPFHLDCNDITLSMIHFFVKNRRGFAKIVLGRSKLYFDLYEKTLSKYDLPIELKYLSVIESGLRPQVKSPAGALGLWQFMYGTGKMYGLVENSYIDERMDPEKSTEAACLFLKKLHDIYGDWNLALAAYNAGPGNVNKAIRRSGGKRTYWEIRPFLPRETQGYVPNFIAATYLLTYYAEHNIKPDISKYNYFQLDTICLTKGIHMSTIAKLIDWPQDEIALLNPVYKVGYIPLTEPKQCIKGPMHKIGLLVSMGDSIYETEQKIFTPKPKIIKSSSILDSLDVLKKDSLNPIVSEKKDAILSEVVWHKVKRGETIPIIASIYGVTVQEVRKLNYLRGNYANGRILKIVKPVVIPNHLEGSNFNNKKDKLAEIDSSIVQSIHVVILNESLYSIASKYKVTELDLQNWNNLSSSVLFVNQKLKIKNPIKIDAKGAIINQVKINKSSISVKPKIVFYTVKPGDMFNRIADRHSLTPQELKLLNPKLNPNSIRIGETIRVK